jgi:ATP-dependent DNA helicase RecQ
LLGNPTEKVVRFGHDRLPTFGAGKERSGAEWQAVIRQLVAADYLRVDVAGFGGIRLTEACGPVLKGTENVFFRKEQKPAPKERKRRRTTVLEAFEESVHPSRPDDNVLFEALRKLRLEIAREQGVPPYLVFGDATLHAMVRHRPTTTEAFARLNGVGQVKLARYGEVFVDTIRGFSS